MPLIHLIVVLIVVGVALWILNTYVPIAQPIRGIVSALIGLLALIWVLNVFGLLAYRVH